jgi:hypothetical protein
VRAGDVLVSRENGEQDLGVRKPSDIYVPPGGTVTIGGLTTVCLQAHNDAPSEDRIFDVTDHLSEAPDSASLAALLELLSTPVAPNSPAEYVFQEATWAVTDGNFASEQAAALLRSAGLDPDALPTGFPDLPNPNAGSTDPTAHRLAGLLVNSPVGGCSGPPLETAACLLDRVESLAGGLPTETVKPKLRAKIGRRIAGVRGKVEAALRATKPRKAAKLQRAAAARARALARMIGKAAAKGKLPGDEASALVDAVNQVADALA